MKINGKKALIGDIVIHEGRKHYVCSNKFGKLILRDLNDFKRFY